MSIFLILLAAGESKRLKSIKAKPYIIINNKTLIEHNVNKFKKIRNIKKIVIVYNKKHKKEFDSLNLKNVIKVIGGKNRSESSFLALKKINRFNCSKVLIHDIARPNVSLNLIKKIIYELRYNKSVIPALKPMDSIKIMKKINLISEIERSRILMSQTPQGFVFRDIFNLHKTNNNKYIPDDASLFIEKNKKIKFIKGEIKNFKITTLEDLQLYEKINQNKITYGVGFDIHKLIKGRKLYLGGINIPFHSGLEGHSDGDAVIHAIIDSLLGASKLKDIGTLFSNKNLKYKNIRSTNLLLKVLNLIKDKNFIINNIDVNIIAQKPSIRKYTKKMINLISKICKIDKSKINIKGKTTEKLGVIGKEKAIACEVITSLIKINE